MIFLIKPRYMTSRAAVTRWLRDRGTSKNLKWGFVGTLDPNACGLLPVCVGWETKLIPLFEELLTQKTYVACIRLGSSRVGDDWSGKVLKSDALTVAQAQRLAEQAVGLRTNFLEQKWQVPPIYSAHKVQGKRAYVLARQGVEVDLPPKPIRVYEATWLRGRSKQGKTECFADVWWKFKVSRGTYIRGFAREAGVWLGTHGFLRYLNRTAVGPISTRHLELHTTESGLRYSQVPMEHIFQSLKPEAAVKISSDVMKGVTSWVNVTPQDLSLDPCFLGDPYLLAKLMYQKKVYFAVLKSSGLPKNTHLMGPSFKYKVLKRIEISGTLFPH
jgi:tRNA pseudouridine(55) synthase